MPSASSICAVTVTAWPASGRTGQWRTSVMAGPALVWNWVLRPPGEPKSRVVSVLPVASSQLPCRRRRISGCPFNQRTFARSVAVLPSASVCVSTVRIRFAAVSPRSEATICRQPPLNPPLACHADSSCVPWKYQPLVPASNVPLATRFAPPDGMTSTLSTRHSPAPRRKS